MTYEEQIKIQKIMNWFTMTHLVSNKEQLYFLKKDRDIISSSINKEDSILRKWFDNFSNNIINKLENEL